MPAGLVYVSDALPGIRRSRARHGFIYRRPDGSVLRDEDDLRRIRQLAIPPAYSDVWICPLANGHLQATGRDARGRKQYRYHAEWNAQRKADKFARLEAFGEVLPRIRRGVARDLESGDGQTVSRRVLLATLVRLLDTTFVRVGNDTYARQNHSYGLTTLRNRHADLHGSTLLLAFRGKRGIRHEVSLDDRRVARVVRRCKQLPGQDLFQYEDGGQISGIGSGDVNDYISEFAGERFTAKDFRTWHGTVEALELTRLACIASSDPGAFSARKVLDAVARRLGNTPAVCRKAYVHPAVLALGERLADDSAAMAAVGEQLGQRDEQPGERRGAAPGTASGLQAAERRLLRFLAEYERSAAKKPGPAAKARQRKPPRSRTPTGAAQAGDPAFAGPAQKAPE